MARPEVDLNDLNFLLNKEPELCVLKYGFLDAGNGCTSSKESSIALSEADCNNGCSSNAIVSAITGVAGAEFGGVPLLLVFPMDRVVSKVNELVKSFFFKLKIFFLKSLSFWTSYDMNSLKSELITILPKLYLSSELISILFTT